MPLSIEASGGAQHTSRDLLLVVFRQRTLISCSFLIIVVAVLIYALQLQAVYRAQMKILVRNERVDPLVTPEQNSLPQIGRGVSDQEVGGEMELLKSRDLLERVVLASGLHQVPPREAWWRRFIPGSSVPTGGVPNGIDNNVSPWAEALADSLTVLPLEKSNFISVSYASEDAELAARVLRNLAEFYLEKHLAVHRPPGALEFFQKETERYRTGLATIEAQLSPSGEGQGAISPESEKQMALQQIAQLESRFTDTQGMIREAEERIRTLESQLKTVPERLTTNVMTSRNNEVLNSLKSALHSFEMKRTELLGKYDPSYRAVRDLEGQIVQTQKALAAEEAVVLRAENTDRNPIHATLEAELVKTKSELPILRTRLSETSKAIYTYREKARQLDQKEMIQHDLLRARKIAEENYQLYVRKQEEVRITRELDKQRIVNVSIVETPAVPTQQTGPRRTETVVVGGLLAAFASLGLGLVANFLDPSFRTPDEVSAFLGLPVLAAFPKNDE